ncbi:hypothetical protein FRB96_000940 [Tulasnella sp. 330]|nr:hypothetical protein FRB96_000940 [Tulasnella sp. 330]
MPKVASSSRRAPVAIPIISIRDICSSTVLSDPSDSLHGLSIDKGASASALPIPGVDDPAHATSVTGWSTSLTKVNKLNEEFFDCEILNYQEHLSHQPQDSYIPTPLESHPGILQDLRPVLNLVQPLVGAAYNVTESRHESVHIFYPRTIAPISKQKLRAKLPLVPAPMRSLAEGAAIFAVEPALMNEKVWAEFMSKRNVYRSKPQKNEIVAVPRKAWSFADSLWALVLNTSDHDLGTRWWIITTYERWVFGVMSKDRTNVITTDPKLYDTHHPTLLQALVYWHISSVEKSPLPPAYIPPFDLPHPLANTFTYPMPSDDMNYEVPPPRAIARLINGDAPLPPPGNNFRRIRSSVPTSPYQTRGKTFTRGAFVDRNQDTGEVNVVKMSRDRLEKLRYKSIWLVQGNKIPGVGEGIQMANDDEEYDPEVNSPTRKGKGRGKGKGKQTASKPMSKNGRAVTRELSRGMQQMALESRTQGHVLKEMSDDDDDNDLMLASVGFRDEDASPRRPKIGERLPIGPTSRPTMTSQDKLPSFQEFDHAPGIVRNTAASIDTSLWAFDSRKNALVPRAHQRAKKDGSTLVALSAGPSNKKLDDLCYKGKVEDPGSGGAMSAEYFLKQSMAKRDNFISWARYHGWSGDTYKTRDPDDDPWAVPND